LDGYKKLHKNEDFSINAIEVLLDLPAFLYSENMPALEEKKLNVLIV